jgi:hypothetical protein
MYAKSVMKIGLTDKQPWNSKEVRHTITHSASSIAYQNTYYRMKSLQPPRRPMRGSVMNSALQDTLRIKSGQSFPNVAREQILLIINKRNWKSLLRKIKISSPGEAP